MLGESLHRAHQEVHRNYTEVLKPLELTARQLTVLGAIKGGETQVVIAAKTGVDRSTLAQIIHGLVKRELIVRRRLKTDARAWCLQLTDKGKGLQKQAASALTKAERALLKREDMRALDAALAGLAQTQKVAA